MSREPENDDDEFMNGPNSTSQPFLPRPKPPQPRRSKRLPTKAQDLFLQMLESLPTETQVQLQKKQQQQQEQQQQQQETNKSSNTKNQLWMNTIQSNCEECMRKLGSRGGMSGGSTVEMRSVVLLEYILRSKYGVRVDHSVLGRSIGVRMGQNNSNASLSRRISDILGDLPTQQTKKTHKKTTATSIKITSKTKNASCAVPTKKLTEEFFISSLTGSSSSSSTTFRDLSLRLRSFVLDPSGTAHRASSLLMQILRQSWHRIMASAVSAQAQRLRYNAFMQEWESYSVAYEASCWYLVAKQEQQKPLPPPPKNNQLQNQTTPTTTDQNEEDGMERTLSPRDVLGATTLDGAAFQRILKAVTEDFQAIKQRDAVMKSQCGSKRRARNGVACPVENTQPLKRMRKQVGPARTPHDLLSLELQQYENMDKAGENGIEKVESHQQQTLSSNLHVSSIPKEKEDKWNQWKQDIIKGVLSTNDEVNFSKKSMEQNVIDHFISEEELERTYHAMDQSANLILQKWGAIS